MKSWKEKLVSMVCNSIAFLNSSDRLYRIVAYYMLCADEYGMAKNILSILHAKYHSTLDLENIAFAHLYTCEQDGINPTQISVSDRSRLIGYACTSSHMV